MKRPWALPLAPLYAAGAGLRSLGLRVGLERVRRLAWPVISVGSLSAGGAGKTPFVIALAKLLQREDLHVDVLSRGYGRVGTTVERVDPDGDAERSGDEPLLIAREAGVPVFVGARRLDAGRLAEQAAETGVHLLDDGFQHRQLYRDVDIVLVSSEDLDDGLLPAGNLRERKNALRRADVLAVPVWDDAALERLQRLGVGQGLNDEQVIWRFRREMEVPKIDGPVVAFCGIARPEQFFAGLKQAGVLLAAFHAFADHHRLGPADIELLRKLAATTGAQAMVTTAKDRVRLGDAATRLGLTVYVTGLQAVLEDEAAAMVWLREALREPLSWAKVAGRE